MEAPIGHVTTAAYARLFGRTCVPPAMTREELAEAAEVLRQAAERAEGEVVETLTVHAEQLDDMARREHGPDHGRLARHQQRLRDAKLSVGDEVAGLIDEANRHINDYRETLEGV